MSVYDNQVHKCERCGELYTTKDVNGDKAFKYFVANNSQKASSINANSITISLTNSNELGLCPGCLRSLEEWMEDASVQAEPDLREAPVAKAFREFGENLKELRKNQLKGL